MQRDKKGKEYNILFFSTKGYEQHYFDEINKKQFTDNGFILHYNKLPLTKMSVNFASGKDAVCIFVNDQLDAFLIKKLADFGVGAVLLRCAGFDNIDLLAAKKHGLFVARVPEYSPESVAEHTVALILTLTRHIHLAYRRVREGNFSLDGLLGFTLKGKTAGIIGTGKIGMLTARILKGFGCHVLGYDPVPDPLFCEIGSYAELNTLLSQADIVSLNCPLVNSTYHLINKKTLAQMKKNSLLVNTSRGAIVDTCAVIAALKSGQIGGLAIDVYEQEGPLFFQDHSDDMIDDTVFQQLMTFPNVIITGHQAFLTEEALIEIATVTLQNLLCFVESRACDNVIK